MARGTQLQILISMLRAEVGQSTKVSVGTDNLPALIQKLSRTQEMLYDEYDWPFLRKVYYLDLAAGQRYYDLPALYEDTFNNSTALNQSNPAGLNMERIEEVAINYSGRPVPIDRGIDFQQYAQFNSDDTVPQRASPARRWDLKRTTADAEQIEVWPIPADDTQILCFRGIRMLRPLKETGDVADLDDQLIVLTSAAEILARAGAKDANAVAGAASKRLEQLKARTKGASRQMNMAGPRQSGSQLGKTIIRIGSTTN